MVLILMVAGLVIFFYRLGVPGLMDPDEGRYAEIAREFFVLRDWGIPHLNLLPYLEKPPLVYWLTALSFKVCGFTELAARLPSAVSALGGVFLAYGLGRALWGPGPGVLGALVLASAAGYVVLGRILTLDMAFALCLNLGIGLGYLALSRGQNRLWPWAYFALALAVLTKGPVALVLAGLVWVIWVMVNRRSGRPLIQIRCWVLLAVITLPWFVYVQWRYPEFFRFFILEQHLLRFLTPAIHPEPLWYYVPVLLGLLLPWTWLLPWTLAARDRWRDPDYRFLVIWAAVIVVFFSLSRGKLVALHPPGPLTSGAAGGPRPGPAHRGRPHVLQQPVAPDQPAGLGCHGRGAGGAQSLAPGGPGPGPGPRQLLIALPPDALVGLGPDPPGRPHLAAPRGAVAGGAAALGPGAPGHRPGEPGKIV